MAMSIRNKAWVMIGTIMLIVFLLGGSCVICINRITTINTQVDLLNRIVLLLVESRRQEKNYQLSGLMQYGRDSENAVEKWTKLMAEAGTLLRLVRETLNDAHQKRLALAGNELGEYQRIFKGIVARHVGNNRAWDSVGEAALVSRVRACQDRIMEIQAIETGRKLAVVATSRKVIYGLGGLAAVLLAAFGVLLMVGLVRPIKTLTRMLERIASREGNLTQRLKVSQRDEIGDLAGHFNAFINSIQAVIQDVSAHVNTLNTSSARLDMISADLRETSGHASEKSMAISSTGAQMSANIQSISQASLETTRGIEVISQATSGISLGVSGIAQKAEEALNVS